MNPGDLVLVKSGDGRQVIGTQPVMGPNGVDHHKGFYVDHGTPALVLDVDGRSVDNSVHIKVLIGDKELWIPSGFVKPMQPQPGCGITEP